MQLSEISQLDLFFLSELIGDALGTHHGVLHNTLKARFGAEWKASYLADKEAFRAAVQRVIKEEAEASAAISEQNALKGKFTALRRHLEGVANTSEVPEVSKLLLSAAGYGGGTPRSPKEYKDFLVTMTSEVEANKERFLAHGALPQALALPKTLATQFEDASKKTMREVADTKIARAELAVRYRAVVASIKRVEAAAGAAREGAVLLDDEAARGKADELLALFDQAVAQARVAARKKETEETIPPELTTPVPPDVATPGDGGAVN